MAWTHSLGLYKSQGEVPVGLWLYYPCFNTGCTWLVTTLVPASNDKFSAGVARKYARRYSLRQLPGTGLNLVFQANIMSWKVLFSTPALNSTSLGLLLTSCPVAQVSRFENLQCTYYHRALPCGWSLMGLWLPQLWLITCNFWFFFRLC